MPNWLQEFLYVLALSKKTQASLFFGFFFFFGIQVLGAHMTSGIRLELFGPEATSAIADAIAQRYDKLAWIGLGTFLVLAYKCYKKDRSKLW